MSEWNRARKQHAIFGLISCVIGGALIMTGVGAAAGATLLASGAMLAGRALDPPGTEVSDKPKDPPKP